MSDSDTNYFEKPKKPHIKRQPLHIEVVSQMRSSVRHTAYRVLCEEAERAFPYVTYDEDAIEALHDMKPTATVETTRVDTTDMAFHRQRGTVQPSDQPVAAPGDAGVADTVRAILEKVNTIHEKAA